MKTLYIDCGMGAAGDMLTAALLELLEKPGEFVKRLNALAIPGVEYRMEKTAKCGIMGTHMAVTINGVAEGEDHGHDHGHDIQQHEHTHDHDHTNGHEHSHTGMEDIRHIVGRLLIPEKVRQDILAVYQLIAEAESHAHGVPVTQIHFHEVGNMDAVADITAVCMLIHELSPVQVIASPVHVGSGHVKCAHGILPVPAPATAYILQNVPIYGGGIKGELCTPTGAALLKHFVSHFGDMPQMKVEAVGYGMGNKDFQTANCIRTMLGETEEGTERVLKLSCNLDDMTAEETGYAMEQLLEGGALEVYTIPVGMKKSRPGIVLEVLCREEHREKMLKLLFLHTSTIGVREAVLQRYVLERHTEKVYTAYGEVPCKISSGYGVTKVKYEYEALAGIAGEQQTSIAQIRKELEKNGWDG